MGDDGVADLGGDDLRPGSGDRLEPVGRRGCLHLIEPELDDLYDSLLDDVLAGLDLRLAFESWADSR